MNETLKNIPLSDIFDILTENDEGLESLVINGVDLDKKYGFFSSQSKEDQDVFKAAGIIDNFSRSSNANMIRMYKNFLNDYKEIRRAFSRSAVRDNIGAQKEIVMKERELIQRTIRLMDSVPENAALNVAVFSAVVLCTLGLSTCALTLPAGALGISTGVPEGVAAAAAIAQAPGSVYLVLKLIGMSVKKNDQSNSVLTSQRTTGVLSKQLLIGKLNNMLAKTDKKLQCILSRQLLETNTQVLNAMHKYNEVTVNKLVEKVDQMQRGLEKDLAGTTGKYIPDVKSSRGSSDVKVDSSTKPKDITFEHPENLARCKNWSKLTPEQKAKINDLKKAYAENLDWLKTCKDTNSPECTKRVNIALNQAKQLKNLVKQYDR